MLDSDFSLGKDGIPTTLTERVTFRGRDAVLLVLGLAVVLVSGTWWWGQPPRWHGQQASRPSRRRHHRRCGHLDSGARRLAGGCVARTARRVRREDGREQRFQRGRCGRRGGSHLVTVVRIRRLAHRRYRGRGRGAVNRPKALAAGGSVVRRFGGWTAGSGTTGAGRMRDARMHRGSCSSLCYCAGATPRR